MGTWRCLSDVVCALIHFDIRFRKFASSNPHVELALAVSVVLSGRLVSENSRSSLSRRVFDWGG